MDELLSRKIHVVLITVSGIQGLKTKVGMFIPACISSVLLTLVRAALHTGLSLVWATSLFKISPACLMFLSSPFLRVLPEVFIFLHGFPYPQKKPPTVKFSSYYLMIARKFWIIVNLGCFMYKYTSTVTYLTPLHCQFFGLWAPGLGILVWTL